MGSVISFKEIRYCIIMIKIITALLVILVLLNFISPEPNCSYSTYMGSFTYEEMNFKERNFRNCQAKFGLYKKEKNNDTILYRLCPKKFWQVWNYERYFFSDKFKLPYANWNSIQLRRGAITNKTGFQDF